MKTTGVIFVILGCISLIGLMAGGGNPIGPIFWIAIGAYLIHAANRKKKEREDKENWNNK